MSTLPKNMDNYLVIEGLEGAGKSTLINNLFEYLQSKKVFEIVKIREPGNTVIAEKIRNICKDCNDEKIEPLAELMLMYAARVQTLHKQIVPLLAQKKFILGDRHSMSTFAYQGGGRNIDLSYIQQIQTICLQNIRPKIYIYLDIEPEIGLSRIAKYRDFDTIEKETIDFFHRVRKIYLQLITEWPLCYKIDASQSAQAVLQDSIAIIKKHYSWL